MLLRVLLASVVFVFVTSDARAWQEPAPTPTGGGSSPLLEPNDPGHGSISVLLGLYNHADDGDGNPFLDEELTVIEPVIVFDYDVSDDFGWGGLLSYDHVSSASIDRLSKFPEQSGASADNYVGLDLNFRHRLDRGSLLRWHAGYSFEYDYRSIGVGAEYTWQPVDTDATVSLGVNAFLDTVDIIRFDGTEDGDDDRQTFSLNASWFQILSPDMEGEFGLTLGRQDGFLETPYNAVVIEDPAFPPNPLLDNNAQGAQISEELPDDRLRGALSGRLRVRTRPGRAWELAGRFYADDWDITSLTVEPRYLQTLGTDGPLLDLHYRFYVQSEAKYYQEHYGLPEIDEEHRTQDSDLADFTAHTFGFSLRWLQGSGSSIDIGADYSLRSDDLNGIRGVIGWTKAF